jgi:hypothetical protein
MPSTKLYCPFCPSTAARSQGLASHIRGAHPKHYKKWLLTPTRLEDAKNRPVSDSQPAAKSAKAAGKPSVSMVPVAATQHPPKPLPAVHSAGLALANEPNSDNPALVLLDQAYAQLMQRKQSIQAEIGRLDGLNKELSAIEQQLEALGHTLKVFKPTEA